VWERPPPSPDLCEGEVHVWRAHLNQHAGTRRRLFETLSADERERAARFYFERDREYYVVARGVLRGILGRCLGLEPASLRFDYGPFGKPSLSGLGAGAPEFNLSHSHRIALYAVTQTRRLGVDVELIDERHAGLDIAERFFSAGEVSALRALPAGARTRAFFNCWVRKEAYIKALGEGLSHPLGGFSVSLAPGEPAALLSDDSDPSAPTRWTFEELFPGPLYAAAVAVDGPRPSFKLWHWEAGEP
jgi:4'-phosphopantetheinyl transferase